MRISEAASTSRLSIDTIRYYEKLGLVPKIGRGSDGRRDFSAENVERLALLSSLRETGMAMERMRYFAQLYQRGNETLSPVPDTLATLVIQATASSFRYGVRKSHRIAALPRKLPSLNAVKVFEAAVRHGTTVGAAAEIGVTHGAISRQIQQLEDWIGRPLFKRDTGRLVVTDAGATYAEIAGQALDLLHDGTQALLDISDNVVSVTTTASFASEWLVPRLSDFRSRHPDIEIWVEEGKEIVNPRSGGCDLAIRMGLGEWPGVHVELLMGDRLFPVCSPEIAGKLAHPRNLSKFPLLHDDDPHAQWSRWLSQAGIEMTPTLAKKFARGSRFASSSLLLRAASAEQGVALARERLAESWLDSGKLVRPFPMSVELDNAYWLVTRHGIEPRRPLRVFIAWLRLQTGLSDNSS